jgi:hypothetical protein
MAIRIPVPFHGSANVERFPRTSESILGKGEQVRAILEGRSRFYRGSIHATASALNSSSQSACFNSSRHPESSTRGNARIAAHKSWPNAPVLSTWRLISPENRSGLRSGNCKSFPLLIRHRQQASNAPTLMAALVPNECVYLNGCDLLRPERTDVVGAGRGLQFFRLIALIRWLPNPRTRADRPYEDQSRWGVRG